MRDAQNLARAPGREWKRMSFAQRCLDDIYTSKELQSLIVVGIEIMLQNPSKRA